MGYIFLCVTDIILVSTFGVYVDSFCLYLVEDKLIICVLNLILIRGWWHSQIMDVGYDEKIGIFSVPEYTEHTEKSQVECGLEYLAEYLYSQI